MRVVRGRCDTRSLSPFGKIAIDHLGLLRVALGHIDHAVGGCGIDMCRSEECVRNGASLKCACVCVCVCVCVWECVSEKPMHNHKMQSHF